MYTRIALSLSLYICMYVCMHIYIYIYIHIHMYTHAYMSEGGWVGVSRVVTSCRSARPEAPRPRISASAMSLHRYLSLSLSAAAPRPPAWARTPSTSAPRLDDINKLCSNITIILSTIQLYGWLNLTRESRFR